MTVDPQEYKGLALETIQFGLISLVDAMESTEHWWISLDFLVANGLHVYTKDGKLHMIKDRPVNDKVSLSRERH